MKTTLTSADPSGWYLCYCRKRNLDGVGNWDGMFLKSVIGSVVIQADYTNFRRLFTEPDVAALNEELRTLREELKNMTCKKQIAMDAVQSAGGSIAELETKLSGLEKHKNGVLEHNHQLLQEVESLKQQLSDSESHKKRIIEIARRSSNRHSEQLATLNAEIQKEKEAGSKLASLLLESSEKIAHLKSQPYVMRKADKPDCEGLWKCGNEDPFEVHHVNGDYPAGPYYYLGPIPVVVEQQPPKVVNVRCKKTGEVCRAIPSPCGSSLAVINDDGSFRGNEMAINWEEVQS